ncbi:hypothetical protein RclHR1_10840005 [Rhizophagus clarus]|uniref:Uncharacterized protein n=1 Tax=Rhizophagus clarus TaxID=94130 RepID=A0A2Z6Q2P4_9GLOM|nr:hypothetical protein RclHR1_10840005 [Rhizophagus clarus]
MNSIINNSAWLLFIMNIVMMNWNTEATLINTQWTMQDYQLSRQKQFQINENNDNELSGKFLHITDIHLDKFYLPNSDPSKFCHDYSEESKDKSGKFGTPQSKCDSSYALVNSTFSFLKENFQDIDFIIYTGDSLRHGRDQNLPLTKDYIKWTHKAIINYIMETFDIDKIKFIPTLGNNDEWVHNQLEGGQNTLFSNLTQIWEPLKLNLTSDFLKGGYFRQDINSKLSIFSLNSMYFFSHNERIEDCKHKNSPGAIQLKWFRHQLISARKEKRKVFIVQHIPPLNSEGHTNLDTLTFVTVSKNRFHDKYSLLYLDKDDDLLIESNKEVILVLNNAPSIYPVHNSGIREYTYSTSLEMFGILTDYIQYYADIKKANKIGKLEWEIEYIASKTYNMKQLSPPDWGKVLVQMKNKNSKLWKIYSKYVTVSEY